MLLNSNAAIPWPQSATLIGDPNLELEYRQHSVIIFCHKLKEDNINNNKRLYNNDDDDDDNTFSFKRRIIFLITCLLIKILICKELK